VAMVVTKIEPAVMSVVSEAIMSDEPRVTATLASDDRYERALASVARAQQILAEYRDGTELQAVLGMRDWAQGLRVRREGVEVARRALRATPRPEVTRGPSREFNPDDLSAEHAEYQASIARRVLAEVSVFPKTADNRLTLPWHGADEPVVVAVR
jgi:hypothetical protein